MKYIRVTQGKYAIVDDADYDLVSQYRSWCYTNCGHAMTTLYRPKRGLLMHRLITGAQPGFDVDHINGNGLDNRRSNLRVCLHSENVRNTRKRKGSSKYKGVTWKKDNQKWAAQCRLNGKTYPLGLFDDEFEAALAYDEAVRRLHGEFASPNFGSIRCDSHVSA